MDLWHKMVFPVRRMWFSVSARVKARKNGGGLLKLHDDIQTCGYKDVEVMWEMLRGGSESDLTSSRRPPKRRKQGLFGGRIFVWSNHNAAASSSFSTARA